jgi:hypothetical protein
MRSNQRREAMGVLKIEGFKKKNFKQAGIEKE